MKIKGTVKADGTSVIEISLLPEEMRRVLELIGLLAGAVFAGRDQAFDEAISVVTGIMSGKCHGTEFQMVLFGGD